MVSSVCRHTHTIQFGFVKATDGNSVPVYNVMYVTTCSFQELFVCRLTSSVVRGLGGSYGEAGSAHLKCSEIPTLSDQEQLKKGQ